MLCNQYNTFFPSGASGKMYNRVNIDDDVTVCWIFLLVLLRRIRLWILGGYISGSVHITQYLYSLIHSLSHSNLTALKSSRESDLAQSGVQPK